MPSLPLAATPDALLTALRARGRAQRPIIGGHRGASLRAPENTLAAFRAAIEDGAELVELDVHSLRDGGLAVLHDHDTARTTGVSGAIASLRRPDLATLDAGAWKGAAWTGEPIPELDAVLALIRGRVAVNVEVKGAVATVAAVAQAVSAQAMGGSVVVSSFDPVVVRAAAALHPPLLTGLLCDALPPDPVAAARAVGAHLLHVEHTLLTAPLVAALHDANLGVVAWTVNEASEMRRLAALGIDVILSDDPALLRTTVGATY